jgi:hypothetical protein
MHQHVAGLVDNADMHRLGVRIDATIECVLVDRPRRTVHCREARAPRAGSLARSFDPGGGLMAANAQRGGGLQYRFGWRQ